MSRGYLLSKWAELDLLDIWDYVHARNPPAADELIDRITSAFKVLATFPDGGADRGDICPGMRSFPVGNFIIFYAHEQGDVFVRRVLRGSRDVEQIMSRWPRR